MTFFSLRTDCRTSDLLDSSRGRCVAAPGVRGTEKRQLYFAITASTRSDSSTRPASAGNRTPTSGWSAAVARARSTGSASRCGTRRCRPAVEPEPLARRGRARRREHDDPRRTGRPRSRSARRWRRGTSARCPRGAAGSDRTRPDARPPRTTGRARVPRHHADAMPAEARRHRVAVAGGYRERRDQSSVRATDRRAAARRCSGSTRQSVAGDSRSDRSARSDTRIRGQRYRSRAAERPIRGNARGTSRDRMRGCRQTGRHLEVPVDRQRAR